VSSSLFFSQRRLMVRLRRSFTCSRLRRTISVVSPRPGLGIPRGIKASALC
jgi:hypothetical protein